MTLGSVGPVTVTIFAFLMAYVCAWSTAGNRQTNKSKIGRIHRLLILCSLPGLSFQIQVAIEIDLAVDECFLDQSVRAERVSAEQRQIGILADFDTADPVVDSELDRRIQGDHFERIVFTDFAVVVMEDTARFFVEPGQASCRERV